MNTRFWWLIASLFLTVLGPALAGEIGVEVVFSPDEHTTIRAYYETHGTRHDKHAHKHKSLPPGIAKNLERGKPLPPGIAKQVLPGDLERSLPPVRDGYQRMIVDGRVLLVEVATQVIHDVLVDVVLK